MRYQVTFVSDTALPEGVEYAFARQGGETHLFIRESCINPTTGRCEGLTRAWTTWQSVELEEFARAQ